MEFNIEQSSDKNVLDRCALMMSQSEPWITLQRSLEDCKESMQGAKEIFIAKHHGELVGFIVLQMQGVLKGYIQSIYVSPEVQNSGLGTNLVSFAEQRIFLISPNVFMLVSTFNEKAIRLYLRLGFEKIGVLRNFVADGFDEFLLRKTIGSLKAFKKNM